MINIKFTDDPNAIHEYRSEWDSLHNQGNHEPSTSFEWTSALLSNHKSLFRKFFLLIVEKQNRIVGILPFITKEERLLGSRLTTITPISELYNTHSDFLIEEFSDEVSDELVNTLINLPFKWDLFRTTRFLEQHPAIRFLCNALDKYHIKYRVRYEQPSFFLTLGNTFNNYLESRSGKFRNYLSRMQKKLSKVGKLNFLPVTNADDFNVTYNTLLDIEKRSWKHAHGTAISAIERQTGFYRSLCYEGLKSGRLHLFFLYINTTPVAYDLGYISGNRYFYLKTSFDESLKSSSPATVLRAKLIESLIEKGIKSFDFPGEPYSWEKQWTDELRWHKSLMIYNKTSNAFLYKLLTTLKERLSDKSAEKNLVYHNPHKLKAPEK